MQGSVVAFYNTLDAIAAKWTQARRLPKRLPNQGDLVRYHSRKIQTWCKFLRDSFL
jgi:hypothetical protein